MVINRKFAARSLRHLGALVGLAWGSTGCGAEAAEEQPITDLEHNEPAPSPVPTGATSSTPLAAPSATPSLPTALPTVGECPVFSADDAWNTPVDSAKASSAWTQVLAKTVGATRKLHPDVGVDFGIPVNIVPAGQTLLPVKIRDYPEESDKGPFPFPSKDRMLIEGGNAVGCSGDCHILVVQQGSCMLYEGWSCRWDGGWSCANTARFDLKKKSQGQRPSGHTSADAAGLAILPGLLRFEEVQAGEIRHAIRFTTHCSRDRFVAPASHQAGHGECISNGPPMGLRIRLKADFKLPNAPRGVQTVLAAMKKYGMILADNGSDMFFQGEPNAGWVGDYDLEPLKQVPASAFEALEPGPLSP